MNHDDVYSYIMRRTQIYLDDQQHSSLAALANERGVTASAVIREAIDQYIARRLSPQQKLAELRTLGEKFGFANPGGTDSAVIVDSLRSADAERLKSLA